MKNGDKWNLPAEVLEGENVICSGALVDVIGEHGVGHQIVEELSQLGGHAVRVQSDLVPGVLQRGHHLNIQGTFKEHSGNIQGKFGEHSVNIQ